MHYGQFVDFDVDVYVGELPDLHVAWTIEV
jgi:hypothetical protein